MERSTPGSHILIIRLLFDIVFFFLFPVRLDEAAHVVTHIQEAPEQSPSPAAMAARSATRV